MGLYLDTSCLLRLFFKRLIMRQVILVQPSRSHSPALVPLVHAKERRVRVRSGQARMSAGGRARIASTTSWAMARADAIPSTDGTSTSPGYRNAHAYTVSDSPRA